MSTESETIRKWEAQLLEKMQTNAAELLAQSLADPVTSTADECWAVIWNKPMYANTREPIANRKIAALAPFMIGAWRDWGLDGGRLKISHAGGRNNVLSFEVAGADHSAIADLKIAPHRLFAIQGGASFLRALVAENGEDSPFRGLATLPLESMVQTVQKSAGRGWGHITALHLLTDFGLAVKPDLHLVRTVRELDLLPDLGVSQVPSWEDALRINGAVNELGKRLYGSSFGPRNRRYLDKVLMEVSKQQLIGLKKNGSET